MVNNKRLVVKDMLAINILNRQVFWRLTQKKNRTEEVYIIYAHLHGCHFQTQSALM